MTRPSSSPASGHMRGGAQRGGGGGDEQGVRGLARGGGGGGGLRSTSAPSVSAAKSVRAATHTVTSALLATIHGGEHTREREHPAQRGEQRGGYGA